MSHAANALELFRKHVGNEEGVGEWFKVDQSRINDFADATLDHQFIHIDPEKSAKLSPYKVTIAHGFLTLSLVPYLGGIRTIGSPGVQQYYALREYNSSFNPNRNE
jgi:acyl dehydratase